MNQYRTTKVMSKRNKKKNSMRQETIAQEFPINQTLGSSKPPKGNVRYVKNANYYNQYSGINEKLLPQIKPRKGSH